MDHTEETHYRQRTAEKRELCLESLESTDLLAKTPSHYPKIEDRNHKSGV